MREGLIATWHAEARREWPKVMWPLSRYAEHVGASTPRYPCDLYLGGAAGHRVDEAWAAIERDLAPRTVAVLAHLPCADWSAEELWSETRTRLMRDDPRAAVVDGAGPPAMIVRYRGLVSLRNYFVVVGRRLAVSRQRRTEARERAHREIGQSRADVASQASEGAPGAGGARFVEAMAGALRALTPEQRFLLRMIYDQGMSQRDAGALLGWSPFKANRQVRAAIESLREAVASHEDVEWNDSLRAGWERAWTRAFDDFPPSMKHASREGRDDPAAVRS